MSLLVALVIGVAAGVGGGLLFLRNLDYLLMNILAGVIGAILGLALYVFATAGGTNTLMSVSGTLCTLLGAVGVELLYIFVQAIPKKKKKNVEQ